MDDNMQSKDIYLRKGREVVGLHAIGYAGPYEFDLQELDGSIQKIKTDFMELEKWGNEYDANFKMIGRGSFRVFDLTIEHAAKEFESDGWVRFQRSSE